MFHNVFSDNNANLQKFREINVDDIGQVSSVSLYDREQCQHLKIHSLNIFHMMTHIYTWKDRKHVFCKEYITTLQVSIAKISCERLLFSETCVTM